jgi:hypothetical protein
MEQKLPALMGTEKQVKWADAIREKAMANIKHVKCVLASVTEEELPAKERDAALATLDAIAAEASASVWIDQREWLAGSLDYFDFTFSDLFMRYGTSLPDVLRSSSHITASVHAK